MYKKIISNKYFHFLIIVIASILFSFNFFRLNLSEFNEARIHIIRITSIKDVILNNIFPCFISSKHMMGFGYALNIFYGPLTTYIPILFSFLFNSSIMGLKLFTLLTVILSGISMYNFILKVSKRKSVALLASLIYIAAPYKLTDIYSRNAVGEYTSFIFIPVIFEGLYELLKGDKKRHYLIVVGAVFLILSHTITTIYVALFAFIYLAVNYKLLKNKKVLKNIIIDLLLIILLTVFYLVPLLEHKIFGNYTIFDSESMGTTPIRVFQTGLEFSELFTSEFGSQEIVFSLGIVIIFSLILSFFTYKKLKDKKEYTLFMILSFLCLWMCTNVFPWFILPNVLGIVQFAWRLEGFFIFFVSYICAYNLITISEMIKDKKRIFPTIVTVIILLCGFGGTARYIKDGNLQKDINYEKNITNKDKYTPYEVNREYLPIKCDKNLNYLVDRENKVIVLTGNAKITDEEKNGLNLKFTASNIENAKLELPYIFYCGYTVKLNDKEIKPYESVNGFLCIDLKENGNVTVNYTGTKLEKVGFIISGVTLTLAIMYIIIKRNRRENWRIKKRK